jgi:predicted TIM-barrel fold metal-dependent hydrolase
MRVFDCHIHVQPWELLKPEALALMRRGRTDLSRVEEALKSPAALLSLLDDESVERAVLINYVAPEVMGFDERVNDWVVRFAAHRPDRLLAAGSLHPRRVRDARGETLRLFESGIRLLKIHPPHQMFSAAAHREGDEALAGIYAAAEEAGRPVTIHTGTSVFPGARNRFADPMAVDDVAVDFPRLTILLAHAGRPLYMDTAVFLARRHPNVYLELSGIPPQKLLEYLPRLEELSGKCVWGTDWPSPGVASMKRNVEALQTLGLSAGALETILWSNPARLIR